MESVRGIADEIVLVDTGSRDGTITIARSFGARVLPHKWRGDFSAARNAGLAGATGDWILCVDADERLEAPTVLRKQIERARSAVGGFVVERRDRVNDRDSGRALVHAVGIVRVLRRHPGIRFVGAVHERPGETVLACGLRLGVLTGTCLNHLVSALLERTLRAKQLRYLRLLDRELIKDPREPWFRYYRGKTRWYLDDPEGALEDFRAVERSKRAYRFLRASASCMRALLLHEGGRGSEALRAVRKSIETFPRQSLGHAAAGEILYGQRQFEDAAREFRRVRLSLRAAEAVHGDYYFAPETRAYKLGCCALAVGRLEAVSREFGRGIAANATDAGCYFGMAHVALAKGDRSGAKYFVRAATARDPAWRAPRKLGAALATKTRKRAS